MYSMCMNDYSSRNFSMKNLLYIDGHTRAHGNIAEFKNSCRCLLFSVNCSFEEYSSDKELFLKRRQHICCYVCNT